MQSLARGVGRTKKESESKAAAQALKELEQQRKAEAKAAKKAQKDRRRAKKEARRGKPAGEQATVEQPIDPDVPIATVVTRISDEERVS